MPMPITENSSGDGVPSGLNGGLRTSEPMLWASAGALVFTILLLVGLLSLLTIKGFGYFWPQPLLAVEGVEGKTGAYLGVLVDTEVNPVSGAKRELFYRGGESYFASPLVWLDHDDVARRDYPQKALVLSRVSEEPLFGFIEALSVDSAWIDIAAAPASLQVQRVRDLVRSIESGGSRADDSPLIKLRLISGREIVVSRLAFADIYAPNAMTTPDKFGHFLRSGFRFLSEAPRRSNVQGGVFPAIVGTVTLVVLMSLIVSPLGVLAAIYLQEYAQRGPVTRLVRIAVNNLAGVPSIVFGVFGLGFFVYVVGGSIDELLFSERLPSPTLGTPGMLWAALTMALLTLPVVVVSTEEGLARVPTTQREGSLALGATRAETLWHVVLPAAMPAVLTGLILAVARATGEVAPLILVGVAKYAPGLPVSTEFPFLHLDRQFMHLGFYIYDVGFQSPQLETAEGLVFATALLLVVIVLLLNMTAVLLRNRLRETFKPGDMR